MQINKAFMFFSNFIFVIFEAAESLSYVQQSGLNVHSRVGCCKKTEDSVRLTFVKARKAIVSCNKIIITRY